VANALLAGVSARRNGSRARYETADKLLDAGEDRLLIAREDPVIDAVEFDKLRLGNVAGEMPAGTSYVYVGRYASDQRSAAVICSNAKTGRVWCQRFCPSSP
jgi:hypothetical protein